MVNHARASMNSDIQQYKYNLLIFSVIVTYACLHYALAGNYEGADFSALSAFSTPMPYAQRVLIPLLVNAFMWLTGQYFPLMQVYFLFECIAVLLLYFSLYLLMLSFMQRRAAELLSLLFIMLCSLTFVVNYRFSIGAAAMINFPYDTPAMVFIFWGMRCVLQQRWLWLAVCVVLATLNRETSILIILLLPALNARQGKPWLRPFVLNLFLYILVRTIVLILFSGNGGEGMEWWYRDTAWTHFEVNMSWLLHRCHVFFLLAEMAFLPMFWFVWHDYIARCFLDIRFVVLFHFLCLTMVAHLYESRIFGESIALLYVPLSVALPAVLNNEGVRKRRSGMLAYIDRYAVLFILAAVLLLWKIMVLCLETVLVRS